MAKNRTPQQVVEAAQETPLPQNPLIALAELEVEPAKGVLIEDDNSAPVEPESVFTTLPGKELDEVYSDAEEENKKLNFFRDVMEARKPPPRPEPTPQPVPPRVLKQTEAEMAAGAARNKHYEEHHSRHGRPPVDPADGTMQPVFRPGEYVPDGVKNQGVIKSRDVTVS
jgi:hypothetical protein